MVKVNNMLEVEDWPKHTGVWFSLQVSVLTLWIIAATFVKMIAD